MREMAGTQVGVAETRRSQVVEGLDGLGQRLALLAERREQLEQRLGSVLRANPPTNQAKGAGPAEVLVPMAEAIRNANAAIDVQIDAINSMLERLEV